jgi:hypothetical protein
MSPLAQGREVIVHLLQRLDEEPGASVAFLGLPIGQVGESRVPFRAFYSRANYIPKSHKDTSSDAERCLLDHLSEALEGIDGQRRSCRRSVLQILGLFLPGCAFRSAPGGLSRLGEDVFCFTSRASCIGQPLSNFRRSSLVLLVRGC